MLQAGELEGEQESRPRRDAGGYRIAWFMHSSSSGGSRSGSELARRASLATHRNATCALDADCVDGPKVAVLRGLTSRADSPEK
jgi:hypothetical protein